MALSCRPRPHPACHKPLKLRSRAHMPTLLSPRERQTRLIPVCKPDYIQFALGKTRPVPVYYPDNFQFINPTISSFCFAKPDHFQFINPTISSVIKSVSMDDWLAVPFDSVDRKQFRIMPFQGRG